MAEKCKYKYCTPYYVRCEAFKITHPRTAELAGHPSTPTFAASVDSGLKELITFRESRAQMIAPLPMVLAGLAAFPGPRAARLRRVASFGLSWRPLCGLRLCACGSSRLCGRLLGVCGSLRLSFLRSSAWGSSLPPLRFGKELNRKLLVYARHALGDQKCKDRTLRGAGGFHMNSGYRVWVWASGGFGFRALLSEYGRKLIEEAIGDAEVVVLDSISTLFNFSARDLQG